MLKTEILILFLLLSDNNDLIRPFVFHSHFFLYKINNKKKVKTPENVHKRLKDLSNSLLELFPELEVTIKLCNDQIDKILAEEYTISKYKNERNELRKQLKLNKICIKEYNENLKNNLIKYKETTIQIIASYDTLFEKILEMIKKNLNEDHCKFNKII